jgi:hypothetical protein
MKTHSLKDDLKMLELGSNHLPRFSKDTTDGEVRDMLNNLKGIVREQRDALIRKYQGETGNNEEKIKEINAAADRILSL